MSIKGTLYVTEIQRFCMHDGPGVRTTVFLKGCPLRCAWCHNPETQKSRSELLFYRKKCIGCTACVAACESGAHVLNDGHLIDREKCLLCGKCTENCPTGALDVCGKEYTVRDILSIADRDRAFYGELGGVTLSGGEPFMQGGAVVESLKACKENGFPTAVETCGYADSDVILQALPYVDLFLWDLKDTDVARHKRYTGVDNGKILRNLSLINEARARIRLRCILVAGVNTDESHYAAIAEIARTIHNLDGVELIPYHAYGGAKMTFIGGEDSGRKEWIPDESEIKRARLVLRKMGVKVL